MAMPLLHTSSLFSLTTNTTNVTTTTTSLSYHRPSIARTRKSFSSTCSFHREYIPNHIQDPNYVRIFDTTLREGEHSLGTNMTPKQKLALAHQIAKVGVDIIEVGTFSESNKDDDLESARLIAHEVGNTITDDDGCRVPVICGLARCTKEDIDKAWGCLKHAKYPRIHMGLETREIDTKYKLLRTSQEVIEKAKSLVTYARSLGFIDIQCTAQDDGRSERKILCEFLGEVIKAGATTLNILEFVGYLPHEFRQLITDIRANTSGIESVILSTHCHNDLGLATTNTLEGAYSGARQVEVTINGIGDGAGHASLEQVVMAMKPNTKVLGALHTGVDARHTLMTSKMVEEYSGILGQPRKAIVGANAITHQSETH